MKCFIYWTADLKSSKLWSLQLWTQFKQLRIEAWKSQDFSIIYACLLGSSYGFHFGAQQNLAAKMFEPLNILRIRLRLETFED